VPVPCAPKLNAALPPREEIESFISPYTKAILICNPNNPTGAVCSDDELLELLDICHKRDLYLIADETYREFVFDQARPRCVFELAKGDPRVIVIDSLSKRFSLCGARIGCLITWHEGLMQAAFHIAQARLAAATIEQAAAARMLNTITPEYLVSAREEYRKRRDVAVRALSALPGVVAYPPKGGFYLLADLPVADAEDFASFMLTDFEHQGETTFVAPAAGFYMRREAGRRAIRVAFVLNQADTQRAIEVLGYGLIEYAKRNFIASSKSP
jgi:aspartate aminotransferase